MPYAHSKNAAGQRHDLVEHLTAVAERAREYADKFGAGDLAYWAGMWHDLGKFHPDFQRYLLDCEASPGKKHRGPDHKRAGTMLAMGRLQPLAFLVKGHHGGLPSMQELPGWVKESAYQDAIRTALDLARVELGPRLEATSLPTLPAWANDKLAAELFVRMLFSTLVDADCLDTEGHFNPDRSEARTGALNLQGLWRRFKDNQSKMLDAADDIPVNRVRSEVYDACLVAAAKAPGFFRLTVPTGGGKTRSGLAFALRHALEHGLDRVIVAIP